MNDFNKILMERQSCKSFVKGKRIPAETLEQILTAGTFAPTGKGMQSPLIVVVNTDEQVAELSRLNAEILGVDYDPFYGAPTVAVVFSDSNYFTHLEDGALVMGNMLNSAYSLGVGACWIHRAREMFLSERGKSLMKKWSIPENYVGIGNCILGYPTGVWRERKPRKKDYIRYV